MKSKRTLVIGASENPERYSNKAIKMLRQHDHEVVAIGLKTGEVEGVKIQIGKPNFDSVDTITLYLNPKRQEEYYDYLISLHPKRVIFNPGTENYELETILEKNGINYEEACTLVLLSTDQY